MLLLLHRIFKHLSRATISKQRFNANISKKWPILYVSPSHYKFRRSKRVREIKIHPLPLLCLIPSTQRGGKNVRAQQGRSRSGMGRGFKGQGEEAFVENRTNEWFELMSLLLLCSAFSSISRSLLSLSFPWIFSTLPLRNDYLRSLSGLAGA